MAQEYRLPDNTETTLYIDSDNLPYDFGRLMDRIGEHFGEDCTLDQFDIEIQRIKITGFGCSCCYDATDYCNYLVITKRKEGEEASCIQKYSLRHMTDIAEIG